MILEMKNITKRYGNTLANDRVSLHLEEGEILSIIGENGAGKSTIMKILYGLEEANSGQIILRGKEVNFKSPQDAIKSGIGMVQQHFMLFSPFSVFENIVYGDEPSKGIFFDRKKARKKVEETSKKYNLKIDPDMKVSDASVGMQQRVEILKVLYQEADIIIFDEPSAVLTPNEVKDLLKTIKNLAQNGKSIILITHKLSEVMEVSDRILVMRKGRYIADMKKDETSAEELSYLMVNRRLDKEEIASIPSRESVLRVKDLIIKNKNGRNALDKINIEVNEGEIVGIAGVSGNGQSELIEAITGLRPIDSGYIHLSDKDITNKRVSEIRNSGLATIPEDRYLMGCAKRARLYENLLMSHQYKKTYSKRGLLNNKIIKRDCEDLLQKYDVRYDTIDQRADQLSGGNLQKLIIAREISQNSKLLIAAEPTRGVDIGAMEFIHKSLLEKRDNYDGVLLISSELSEIIKLSDRIYTIFEGKINGEFLRNEVDETEIGLYMTGGVVE